MVEKSKPTRIVGEYWRNVVTEDGVSYRHEVQEMDPVKKHVKFLTDKVNSAPKSGNKHDMHYIGSIPLTILTDWCNKTGTGLDAYARNQFGEKKIFMKHLRTEFPVFLAPQKKSSSIIMPRL